ncbi:MAG: NUDIX domain-containing protein [Bacteroidota bacterium]
MGKVRNIKKQLLSDNWFSLNKVTFEYQREDGNWETQEREAYDRGNGAAILLYNKMKRSVVLTRQFRMPTYLNGNLSGMMIEVCAGILENGNAEETIRRELKEETGYEVDLVEKVFECYTSPGSVTEKVHFFIGEYEATMKVSAGGGDPVETENIEVLELSFAEAFRLFEAGEIKDAKTILLLQWARINQLFDDQ